MSSQRRAPQLDDSVELLVRGVLDELGLAEVPANVLASTLDQACIGDVVALAKKQEDLREFIALLAGGMTPHLQADMELRFLEAGVRDALDPFLNTVGEASIQHPAVDATGTPPTAPVSKPVAPIFSRKRRLPDGATGKDGLDNGLESHAWYQSQSACMRRFVVIKVYSKPRAEYGKSCKAWDQTYVECFCSKHIRSDHMHQHVIAQHGVLAVS